MEHLYGSDNNSLLAPEMDSLSCDVVIMFTCSPLVIHSLGFILATIVWQTRMFLLGCFDSLSSKLIEDFLERLTRAIG